MDGRRRYATGEQLRYARVLALGMKLGLALVVAAFAAYVLGLLPAYLPPQRLPEVWGLPLAQYLEISGKPSGWDWLRHVGHGEATTLLGVVLLCSVTMVCLAAVLPLLWRRGERAYAAIVVVQLAVLLLAASGLLGGGGH